MKSKKQVKQLISRLREGVDPKFKDDISAIADSLDTLVDNAASELGRSGGVARAKKLGSKRRKAIASNAARARWGKK